MNIFKVLGNEKDKEKNRLLKLAKDKSWDISKKVVRGKVTAQDVDELESLYDEYYDKYPSEKDYEHSKSQIQKLRTFAVKS